MTIFAGLLLAVSLIAAGSADLVNLVDRANDAEFSGRQLSVTFTEDGMVTDIRHIAQGGGMAMAETAGGVTLVGGGVLYKDDNTAAAMPNGGLPMVFSERYDVQISSSPQGTEAFVVEDGAHRLRYVFDAGTGAALLTEIYDGEGELFRMQVLIADAATSEMPSMEDMPEPEMMVKVDSPELPDLMDYQSGGEFEAEGGGIQRFYSDGLFRFSVFAFPEGTKISGMDEVSDVTYAGIDNYHRAYGPTTTTVSWQAAKRTYVVTGDVPPDHMAEIVSQLPPPAAQNWFARTWRSLFG